MFEKHQSADHHITSASQGHSDGQYLAYEHDPSVDNPAANALPAHDIWSLSLHACVACSVRMSALALLKIAMHARSGGSLEVCGGRGMKPPGSGRLELRAVLLMKSLFWIDKVACVDIRWFFCESILPSNQFHPLYHVSFCMPCVCDDSCHPQIVNHGSFPLFSNKQTNKVSKHSLSVCNPKHFQSHARQPAR